VVGEVGGEAVEVHIGIMIPMDITDIMVPIDQGKKEKPLWRSFREDTLKAK